MDKKFREAFLDKVEQENLKIAVIARDAGVSKDMLNKFKQGRTQSINVDDAILVARYFGQTVNEFIGEDRPTLDDQLAQRLAKLSEKERQILIASLEAILASRQEGGPIPGQDAG